MYYKYVLVNLFEDYCWQPESHTMEFLKSIFPQIDLGMKLSFCIFKFFCFSFRLTVNSIVKLHKYSWVLLCVACSPENSADSRLQLGILNMFLILWLSRVFVFSHTHTMLCVLVHKDTSFSMLFDDRLMKKYYLLLIWKQKR